MSINIQIASNKHVVVAEAMQDDGHRHHRQRAPTSCGGSSCEQREPSYPAYQTQDHGSFDAESFDEHRQDQGQHEKFCDLTHSEKSA